MTFKQGISCTVVPVSFPSVNNSISTCFRDFVMNSTFLYSFQVPLTMIYYFLLPSVREVS